MKNTLPTVMLSFLVATSVFLNGVHAKDVMNASAVQSDQSQAAKVVADVHPHVDKQINKMSHDALQLDGRSFRLRDYKRIQTKAIRDWLNSWRDQLTLYFG
jgi:hypothetical protein